MDTIQIRYLSSLTATMSFTPLLQLACSEISDDERKASMDSVNPKYVLRNYLCQSAIDIAEQGDFREVRNLLKLMSRPYDEQPEMQTYARLPPAWAYRPGVCMLSCSSWVGVACCCPLLRFEFLYVVVYILHKLPQNWFFFLCWKSCYTILPFSQVIAVDI